MFLCRHLPVDYSWDSVKPHFFIGLWNSCTKSWTEFIIWYTDIKLFNCKLFNSKEIFCNGYRNINSFVSILIFLNSFHRYTFMQWCPRTSNRKILLCCTVYSVQCAQHGFSTFLWVTLLFAKYSISCSLIKNKLQKCLLIKKRLTSFGELWTSK